ncbi:MAG: peptidylprolyl isomerase [Acidobacteria bacterium]|nr:peptidylprolyl isomerase [Acidobacteriota bacterium]
MRQKFLFSIILIFTFYSITFSQAAPIDLKDLKDLKRGNQVPTLQKDRSAQQIYIRLRQMEDERGISSDFIQYLTSSHAGVRKQAALTLGRIGERSMVGTLSQVLLDDGNPKVREMAAFALGEIEDVKGVRALISALISSGEVTEVRTRSAEALGKIAGNSENAKQLGDETNERIINVLTSILPKPTSELKSNQEALVANTLTALMRVRALNAIEPIALQLTSPNLQIRFVAANSLARILRANPGKATKTVIDLALTGAKDQDPLVRAAIATALGATKNPIVLDSLLKLLNDSDQQVQANAIRALGALEDKKATKPLLELGERLLSEYRKSKDPLNYELNLLYLLSTALGQIKDPSALSLIKSLRLVPNATIGSNIETETAIARFGADAFFDYDSKTGLKSGNWQAAANFASGLGEVGGERALKLLDEIFTGKAIGTLDPRAVPEVLRAMSKVNYPNISNILKEQIKSEDVIIRATVAELLMDGTKSDDDFKVLTTAYEQSSKDTMNDAKLAILMALAKFGTKANTILTSALKDPDHLVRRQAVDLLKMLEVGNFENKIGAVATDRNRKFYEDISTSTNRDKAPIAEIITSKGRIRIELFHQDAPLTVANFINLAKKGYFNNLSFHRVVPSFVIQGGDPRGDGNGGPGHQIRCEINMKPYLRGTVGMALSGKDTGGSQFFICHSPQPHLDGGYTVFGQVIAGIEIVDKIVRGDLIEKITIENP